MIKKILFTACLVMMIIIYAFFVNDDLSDNMVRFHVIANSDLKADQELKLCVRDAVFDEARRLTADSKNKKEAAERLFKNSDILKKTAEQVIKEKGFSYSANVSYGNFFFPKKEYGRLSLPSGKYDAMRVEIGEAKGENWWCVMFPPLCISEDCFAEADDEALAYLKDVLTDDEYKMITEAKDTDVIVRFRIVDTIMKLAHYLD